MDEQRVLKITAIERNLSKLQEELLKSLEQELSNHQTLNRGGLEVEISELRDNELMSKPVNHVGH